MNEPINVSNWALEDQPVYKVSENTKNATIVELLSVIIGGSNPVEIARSVVLSANNSLQTLATMSIDQLTAISGVTELMAVRILAVAELAVRYRHEISPLKVSIKNSESVYQLLYPVIGNLQHEEFHIILLNRAHKVIKTVKVSQGGLTGTVIDVRMILSHALKERTTSIVLAHNHPLGNTVPSEADINITRKINDSAKIMDLTVLDHIIVAGERYHSFADNGQML